MRNREEIEKELESLATNTVYPTAVQRYTLEVLLDIREIVGRASGDNSPLRSELVPTPPLDVDKMFGKMREIKDINPEAFDDLSTDAPLTN